MSFICNITMERLVRRRRGHWRDARIFDEPALPLPSRRHFSIASLPSYATPLFRTTRIPKWKALSTLSGQSRCCFTNRQWPLARVIDQNALPVAHSFAVDSQSHPRNLRGRHGGRQGVAGRKRLSPVLLLSVDVDVARWRECQLGGSTGLQRDVCLRRGGPGRVAGGGGEAVGGLAGLKGQKGTGGILALRVAYRRACVEK